MKPIIRSGKFHAGRDLVCGENVVIDVAEEVVVGDRCVLPDNAYLSGRRIEIGDDFFGYSWEWRRLDIGRGRRDHEHAILQVGSRCTFHDNFIDLTRHVTIGNDVGLSPQVTIYTHGYWLSSLNGYPRRFARVKIGSGTIVGFRSVILAGSTIESGAVVGAQSVVSGNLGGHAIYGGNPAVMIRAIVPPGVEERTDRLGTVLDEYLATLTYRGSTGHSIEEDYPLIRFRGIEINVETRHYSGEEDEYTDDLRDFLFRHGIRIYTQRPFRRLT